MQKLRILKGILKRTKADRIILSFVISFFLDALFILLVEPELNSYGDALWYCYAVLSTVGFGDIVITKGPGDRRLPKWEPEQDEEEYGEGFREGYGEGEGL